MKGCDSGDREWLVRLTSFGYIILFIREIEGKFWKVLDKRQIKHTNLCDNENNLSEAENRSDNEKIKHRNGKITAAQITVNNTKEYPELYKVIDWYCNRDSSLK